MYIPQSLDEKILIDGQEKTVQELIYAVRAHDRQKGTCRKHQKVRRAKDKNTEKKPAYASKQ